MAESREERTCQQELELMNFRTLSGADIDQIFEVGPKAFRRRVFREVVDLKSSFRMKKPAKKAGYLIFLDYGVNKNCHAVALFRAYDKYIYYNSSSQKMHPKIAVKLQNLRVKPTNIIEVGTMFQSWKYGNCAYHALAFLGFMLANDELKATVLVERFKEYLQEDPDYVVVKYVQGLVQEMPRARRLNLQCHGKEDTIYYGPRKLKLKISKKQSPDPRLREMFLKDKI